MSASVAMLLVYNAVIVLLWAVSFHQSRVIRKHQRANRELQQALRASRAVNADAIAFVKTTHENFKKLAWATADLMGDDPALQRRVRNILAHVEARDVMAEAKR